jgi:hypothetical protein
MHHFLLSLPPLMCQPSVISPSAPLKITTQLASDPGTNALTATRVGTLVRSVRHLTSFVQAKATARSEQRATVSTLMPMAGHLAWGERRQGRNNLQKEAQGMLLGSMSRSWHLMLALPSLTWTGLIRLVELPI